MLNAFTTAIEETVKNENQLTENGAVGYRTAGSALVDFCFKVSSYRNLDANEICRDFQRMHEENPLLAVKMMFMAGDIRGGMGERRLFGTCLRWLAENNPEQAKAVLSLVPEYSRWDVLVGLHDVPSMRENVVALLKSQLDSDVHDAENGKAISLLAKWLPSVNTSSRTQCALGRGLAREFGMTERRYRKTLSMLRRRLNVVEVRMSGNDWNGIDYNAVPSKANILYKDAFMRHDEERRTQYLADLEAGRNGAKINSSASFPYDIVAKYSLVRLRDPALEAMWKALPDYANGRGGDTICMVDGSGSMGSTVGGTNVTCHDVARSLGIYFSEHMHGAFRGKYISFGANPSLVDLGGCGSLREKIDKCREYDDCANTDIEKAFSLVLKTALSHNLKQEDLPRNILVISDMEFDRAVHVDYGYGIFHGEFNAYMKTLFDAISEKFESAGYKMPRLVFWNVCSRTNTVPIKENENGVALVSGFSPAIADMVFSSRLNPYDVVVDRLNASRYDAVEKAFLSVK